MNCPKISNTHNCSKCLTELIPTCKLTCWKLLCNQNFKGPYLEAEVVEEGGTGVARVSRPTTSNKIVT